LFGTHHIKSRLLDERGTAVEFAIVLPILALLLFGILDFGRVLNYWNDENQLAGDAARYAAVNTNPGAKLSPQVSFKDWVASQASSELRNGSSSVTTPLAVTVWTSGKVGDPVHVCIKATYRLVKLFKFTQDLTFHGDATMRLEQPSAANASDITGVHPDGGYTSTCP